MIFHAKISRKYKMKMLFLHLELNKIYLVFSIWIATIASVCAYKECVSEFNITLKNSNRFLIIYLF